MYLYVCALNSISLHHYGSGPLSRFGFHVSPFRTPIEPCTKQEIIVSVVVVPIPFITIILYWFHSNTFVYTSSQTVSGHRRPWIETTVHLVGRDKTSLIESITRILLGKS